MSKTCEISDWEDTLNHSNQGKFPAVGTMGHPYSWAVLDAKVAIAGIQAQGASNDREAASRHGVVSVSHGLVETWGTSYDQMGVSTIMGVPP